MSAPEPSQPRRVGAWTLTEFVISNVATVVAVVGLILIISGSTAGVLGGALLVLIFSGTAFTLGWRVLKRLRSERQ